MPSMVDILTFYKVMNEMKVTKLVSKYLKIYLFEIDERPDDYKSASRL